MRQCPPPIPPERRTGFEHEVRIAWLPDGLVIETTESYCDSENFRRKSSNTMTHYVTAPRNLLVAALAGALAQSSASKETP